MFHVVLHSPRIPPNTGNVIRLCANAGAQLHLIEPLGFPIDHARMRRAGLDYHEFVDMKLHASFEAFVQSVAPARIFAFSSHARRRFDQVSFQAGDALLFGSETCGLPDSVLSQLGVEQQLCLPMRPDNRCLNLSNAVAIAVYEAWRQLGYAGAVESAENP